MSDVPNISTPRAAVHELANLARTANKEGQALANILYDLCIEVSLVASTMHNINRDRHILEQAVERAKAAARKALNG